MLPMQKLPIALGLALWSGAGAFAGTLTLTFDNVPELSFYGALGITFSPAITMWQPAAGSVLDDPNGGPITLPRGICAGPCGDDVLASISFTATWSYVQLFAVSGPGPDTLGVGVTLRAYDEAGSLLGTDTADPGKAFDLLAVAADGIRRIDLWSPPLTRVAWDEISLSTDPLVLATAPAIAAAGHAALAATARGIPGNPVLLAIESVGAVPVFIPIGPAVLDAEGRWLLLIPAVPSLSLTIATLRSFVQGPSGGVIASNPRIVIFS